MRFWSLIIGVAALVQGTLQFLAATGRIDLDEWPFVRTESKALRLGASAVALMIGAVLIGSALID